jgi:hypothetical protein
MVHLSVHVRWKLAVLAATTDVGAWGVGGGVSKVRRLLLAKCGF